MNKEVVLVIDDKPNILEVLSGILSEEGYEVKTCGKAEEALENIGEILPDIVVTDLKMPKLNGLELMRRIREIDNHIPVILITAYGTVSSAVQAIKEGAYDYLTKPIDYDRLKILIKRALNERRISEENIYLKQELEEKYSLNNNVIGRSNIIQKVFNLVNTVASSNSNILILGESGTGKELIARAIYYSSLRKDKQLVVVDCSALPEGLLESELFGHEKGAFTGAVYKKRGRIELADGGTLFLDEIGEMSPKIQAKLLRVLQEKQFVRVGGLEPIKVDFRLIASTNKDLKTEVNEGKFRSDLYYRLNVITIKIPPLRERKEDIPLLIDFFLRKFCTREGKNIKSVSPEVMDCLINYDWPGNVRELENCVERLVVVCQSDFINLEYLPEEFIGKDYGKKSFIIPSENYTLPEIEKEVVKKTLEKTNWNNSLAAKLLNIDRKALYNRIKKYNITRKLEE